MHAAAAPSADPGQGALPQTVGLPGASVCQPVTDRLTGTADPQSPWTERVQEYRGDGAASKANGPGTNVN